VNQSPDFERTGRWLDQQVILRWMFILRQVVAFGIFVVALLSSDIPDAWRGTLASLPVVTAVVLTAISISWTELRGEAVTPGFLYTQFIHDFLLLTEAVHLTGGGASQLSALYILWMSAAALLLPLGSSLLLAALASALFVGDALLLAQGAMDATLVLQLLVFIAVAFGTGAIATRLQAAGEGRARLAVELARMQRRAAGILANIRAGVLTVDGAGHLTYANPAASALLGVPLAERAGERVDDLLARVAPEVQLALIDLEAPDAASLRTEVRRPDGQRIPIGVTTSVVRGEHGEVESITAIIQDIADAIRVEELRTRALRLESVAEIGASLAHEIKNPLASIQSAAEQVGRAAPPTGDVRVLSDLIIRESERLARLLTEFLDFARVPQARLGRIDIRPAVEGAVGLVAAHPDRPAGVRLDVRLAPGPIYAEADADLVHRLTSNLVLNAVQASPPDGVVHVTLGPLRTAELPIGLRFPVGAIVLDVEDQGGGIPDAVRDRLFEPFTTTKAKGTGLGLAIVHRAVESLGGTVLVDPVGAGTRFRVLLPTLAGPLGGLP